MTGLLLLLLALPAASRAAAPGNPLLQRLKEIEKEGAPLSVEIEKIIAEFEAFHREYEGAPDPSSLAARRGSLLQRAEMIDDTADKLSAEYGPLTDRYFAELALGQAAPAGPDGGAGRRAVVDFAVVMGLRDFDAQFSDARKRLRKTITRDGMLYHAVQEAARSRKRLRWMRTALVAAAAALAGIFFWRRRGRAAAPALSGPA